MSTYSQIQAAISQAQPVAYHGGENIPRGDKSGWAITCVCDFSATGIPSTGYALDTTQFANRLQMKTVQTIFIDNSGNNGFVQVYNPNFDQSFSLPPGYQGYFPILAPLISGAKFFVSSTGNQIANVIFLNTLFPLASWAATVTPPSSSSEIAFPVADAILDACVFAERVQVSSIESQATATDVSGSILEANTAQLLIGQNNARRKFTIINIDSSLTGEALWWGFSEGIAIGQPGAYPLAAAASIAYPGGAYQGDSSNSIYVIAATLGHKFSAFWE
jgi:hypothetical protein